MLAAYPQYPTRSARFSRYTTLLAELRAATSSAEDDDERLQWELEGMKFWMAQEFSNSIACTAGKGLIYGSIAPDVQELFTICVSTASRLLQLWASKPSVLQGSSSTAQELTSLLLRYVGLDWQEASLATARRQLLQPGFLSAYTAACRALAAALDTASAAEVPLHLAELTAFLLGTWGGALKMYEDGSSGFADPKIKPLLLPSVQLAGAALRCWAGPTAAGLEYRPPLSSALHAALEVPLILASAAADISGTTQQRTSRTLVTIATAAAGGAVGDSPDVQWLLCCYAAMTAQQLHRQLQGRQPASLSADTTSQRQQRQQQQPPRVAPVHKRLLEALHVPELIGWEHFEVNDHGGTHDTHVGQGLAAYYAALACAVFDAQLPYRHLQGESSSSSSSSSRINGSGSGRKGPPLLTATVHLRRAAVLLELCLLSLDLHVLLLSLPCIRREMKCMQICLQPECGSAVAAGARVDAAVASGILPTLLQQLLPVLARVLQAASPVQTGHIEAAAELGVLLASVVPGPNCQLQQLLGVMQQPRSVRALEACIRCWVQLYSAPSGVWTPALLSDPHKDLVHSQRMTFALTAPLQAALSHPAAGAGQCAGSECFAFCATSLKAGVFAAGQALKELRTAASNAPHSSRSSSSSTSSMDCRRIVYALLQAAMTADVAMAACSSLAGSSGNGSSSSDVSQLRPAWQLLSAHGLHAFGSVLLAVHADGLLPVAVQQELPPELLSVLQCVVTVVAWTGTQLNTMQQQAAAAALPLGSEQGNHRVLSLLQQQERVSEMCERYLTTAESSSSSSSLQGSAAMRLQWLLALRGAVSAELAKQLMEFAAAVSGCFPSKLCCNAPGCTNLAKFSELEAVGGKACTCSGCRTARYCCRACQESHWKAHKHTCRALAAQQQGTRQQQVHAQ